MLPTYDGPYEVGLTTFGLQVPKQVIGTGLLADGQPALVAEEVVFNAFYPASPTLGAKKGVNWLLRPLENALLGWAKFAGYRPWLVWPLVYLYGKWIKIPTYPNAPLRRNEDSESAKWPVVLFSHGLAGTRNMYSDFCARLAAQGHVVLAMAHNDGTAPYCLVRTSTGELKAKYYLKPDEVKYDAKPDSPLALRVDQLELRRLEIYNAHAALSKMISNPSQNGDIYLIDGPTNSSDYDWESWRGAVDMDKDVTLTGHSFGGGTLFSLLSNHPPSGFSQIPITHAIALDPWLDPLPTPGPIPSKGEAKVQLTVINSERFTLWSEHFARLKDLLENWGGKEGKTALFTLVRVQHAEFSDFAVFVPLMKKRGLLKLKTIHRLTLASMKDDLADEIKSLKKEGRVRRLEVEENPNGKGKRLVGKEGDVVVH